MKIQMHYCFRKNCMVGTAVVLAILLFSSLCHSADGNQITHPMKNPAKHIHGNCPNCGMMLAMWARTRHIFDLSESHLETCSIRCAADIAMKAGEQPQKVMVAHYLHPEKMIAAPDATYVLGSSAKGTMTMVSKIAFGSKTEADDFASKNGGKSMGHEKAFTAASQELEKSRLKIAMKRKKMGKIKDPADKDHCTVCGMYPARYPQHRSQVLMKSGATLHFCSAKCLVGFVDTPQKFQQKAADIMSIWVTVYPDGDYEYAKGLYYLVGSKIMGPMGAEPLPFRKKAAAEATAKKEGGKVLRFEAIKPAMLSYGHHKMHQM